MYTFLSCSAKLYSCCHFSAFLHSYVLTAMSSENLHYQSHNSPTSSQRSPLSGHLYSDLKALPIQKGCTTLALLV